MSVRTMLMKNTWLLVAVALTAAGCSKGPEQAAADGKSAAKAKHEHGEWWCDEHGVPEAICTQCHTNLAADFKTKNDWCKEHDRADSQCFICHPEKEAEFAAQYEAKYGKKPPKPSAEGGDEKDHDHHKDHDDAKK